jgi:tetratricopeptide (TPR) repeat protein
MYLRLVLGNLLIDQGDYVTADAHFQEMMSEVKAINDYRSIAWTLWGRADVAQKLGNLEEARKFMVEAYQYVLKTESGVRLIEVTP